MCGAEQPSSATITFDSADKRTEYSTSKQVWQENGIIVTNNKASSTTNVADYVKPVRFYKNSEIIIEYSGMIKIEFTCNSKDSEYITHLKNSIKDVTPTADGNIVTIEFTEAIDNYEFVLTDGAVWLDSITVYTEKQEAGNEGVGVEIDTVSVTIGADITLNYYVNMSDDFAEARMFFTVDEKTVDVDGEKDGERYKFSLPMPPQYMADNVKAELKLDDTVLLVVENYSVRDYADTVLTTTESTELKQLVIDMLYYGAAAQNYTNHNTDNLANAGVEGASAATPTGTDFTLVSNEAAGSYPAYFKGAGVRFDGENSIYVKLSTTENVTLIVDGTEVAVTGTTVYTDGIKATEFGKTYTFELYCDGVLMQTLTYSVNAYAYAKQGESAMGKLALALYRYGQSAVAYKDAENN